MELNHRLARSRSLLAASAAVLIATLSGCADLLPSEETMQKWSPSNIWYRMSPDQLGRLNEGSGLSSDVYYAISDYPERDSAPVPANQTSSDAATVVKPIENAAAAARQ